MKFSVIIPCYNSAKTLHRVLDSLCLQGQEIKQVIVVDDGSQDDTRALIEGYVSRLPIEYQYQTNQGPAAARNTGLARVTGDFVVFLDADDALANHVLLDYEREFLQYPELGMVSGGWKAIREDKITEQYPVQFRGPGEDLLLDYWFKYFHLRIDACAIRASVIKTLRFPTSIKHGEDIVFLSHVLASTDIATLRSTTVDVYHSPESLRHQHASSFKEADRMVDLLFNPDILPVHLLSYRNEYQARHLLSLANKAEKLKQYDLSKPWFEKAVTLHPKLLLEFKTWSLVWRLWWAS